MVLMAGAGSAAVIVSIVIIVLLLLGCVPVIVITVMVIYRYGWRNEFPLACRNLYIFNYSFKGVELCHTYSNLILRRFRSRKVLNPTEWYQSKIESLPLAPEREAKFLGDVTTNGLSWPGDAVGQATQADEETGLWLDLRLLYLTTSHHCVPAYVNVLKCYYGNFYILMAT